jgi:hypothetical protein
MSEIKLPLTNVQMELMKLYGTDMSEADLEELKNVLANFYADKAIAAANAVWDQKGLTNEDMDTWLNKKS